MNTAEITKRNSRWDIAPVLDKHGRPKHAALTERDFGGIFEPLARYRYLPADYLHAFSGGSLDYLVNRLNLLSRRPNLFLARPHQQRASASANHRRLIYELTDKGMAVMEERGFASRRSRPSGNFAHELMTCLVMASFELGARETGAKVIGWQEILDSQSLPETTRHSGKPWMIPVNTIVNGQQIDAQVAADGLPFGVARIVEGRKYFFFCPGIEADCGTEPVDASDFARSSIYKKFVLYLAIEAQSVYRSHFGFPNFYVPFITTSRARLASMMAALTRITGAAGSKIILFKTLPTFTSFEAPRPPSGHMLTEHWSRVGHPPFSFLTS
jgi:hypothetical protein